MFFAFSPRSLDRFADRRGPNGTESAPKPQSPKSVAVAVVGGVLLGHLLGVPACLLLTVFCPLCFPSRRCPKIGSSAPKLKWLLYVGPRVAGHPTAEANLGSLGKGLVKTDLPNREGEQHNTPNRSMLISLRPRLILPQLRDLY